MSYTPPTNPSTWHTPTTAKLGQQDDQQQPPPGSYPENFRQVLSQEEIRVLKECNAESFYYRCIPLGTLFSGLAYIAMKNGHLHKSINYGYAPKMIIGGILGYIGGKLSYQSTCAEKIMKLPNSRLADTLRKRRGQTNFQESISTEPEFSYAAPSSEFRQDNTMFDERRPDLSEHEEGSDSYRKVTESLSPYSESDPSLEPNKFTTYDDLRRENRDDYGTKLSEKYKKDNNEPYHPPNSSSSFPGSSFSDPPYSSSHLPDERNRGSASKPEPYFNPQKNKYGDVWDD